MIILQPHNADQAEWSEPHVRSLTVEEAEERLEALVGHQRRERLEHTLDRLESLVMVAFMGSGLLGAAVLVYLLLTFNLLG